MNRYHSKDRHKPEKARTTASNQAQASSAHMHQPVQLESGAQLPVQTSWDMLHGKSNVAKRTTCAVSEVRQLRFGAAESRTASATGRDLTLALP